jgi:hypothetical protein
MRVVLADPDPELRHAMEQVLAPWQLEVVIEGLPPADTAMAGQRADADTARFVVWRDGEQLVVYDRELEFAERRDSRSGMLDPPTAAAAALTIKTMMRLPPPPPEVKPPPPIPPEAEPGVELRLRAGVATRIARGGGEVTARFGGAAELRPWSSWGWRIGVAGDAGTSTAVDRASFTGTWKEWAILGVLSWPCGAGNRRRSRPRAPVSRSDGESRAGRSALFSTSTEVSALRPTARPSVPPRSSRYLTPPSSSGPRSPWTCETLRPLRA